MVAGSGQAAFAEGSAVRRVNGEAALLLGGGRALLMQLAHPQVAAGVAEHSDFQSAGPARLLRTLRASYAIVFGSAHERSEAVARVNAIHQSVRGHGYRATDPALLLWVHATLVDSALLTHCTFVAPLSDGEQARYYDEMTAVAALLGVAVDQQPPDIDAFRAYVRAMVESLEVSATARELAQALFRAPQAGPAPLLLLARELTAGLLPPRLRTKYGLAWDAPRAAALATAAAVSRRALPLLPRRVRRPPALLLPASARGRLN